MAAAGGAWKGGSFVGASADATTGVTSTPQRAKTITVRREAESLSPTGEIFRAFLPSGQPLYISGGTRAELEAQVSASQRVRSFRYE